MTELVAAERTLWWAGIALVVALALVADARGDLSKAKTGLRAARDARLDLEDRVDALQDSLDGALETIHRLQTQPREPGRGPAG